MRWIWIDAFVDFVSGQRASAVKNVTQAEDHVHDSFPGYPLLPPALMIEGAAQTAGILVGEARGFKENVILAKIRKATFEDYAAPGDQLRYDAVLESIDDRAAAASANVLKNGVTIGRIEFLFSHVTPDSSGVNLPTHNFVFTDEFMRLYSSFRGNTGPKSESIH
ncbi:MAG: beta-hydroxyacyl-ACP dehydratase [Planctomycetota bacterium]